MNLNGPSIKTFLDAADQVLNSNTFLLELRADFTNPVQAQADVAEFIRSGEFKKQVLEQDIVREWENYHIKGHPVLEGDLFKPGFEISLAELPHNDAVSYLRNMLTIEVEGTEFFSPYGNQLPQITGQRLTVNFLEELMLQMNWKLFRMNTDFSSSRYELKRKKELAYFEGGFSSDSATLLVREDQCAFLLLTNGIA